MVVVAFEHITRGCRRALPPWPLRQGKSLKVLRHVAESCPQARAAAVISNAADVLLLLLLLQRRRK